MHTLAPSPLNGPAFLEVLAKEAISMKLLFQLFKTDGRFVFSFCYNGKVMEVFKKSFILV